MMTSVMTEPCFRSRRRRVQVVVSRFTVLFLSWLIDPFCDGLGIFVVTGMIVAVRRRRLISFVALVLRTARWRPRWWLLALRARRWRRDDSSRL